MDIIEIILLGIIGLCFVALLGICAFCYHASKADPYEL